MDAILGEQPELKEKVFSVLKQYAAERRVECLAYALCMVLTQECHQPLIDSIRYEGPPPRCPGALKPRLPVRAEPGEQGGSGREGDGRILQGRDREDP